MLVNNWNVKEVYDFTGTKNLNLELSGENLIKLIYLLFVKVKSKIDNEKWYLNPK